MQWRSSQQLVSTLKIDIADLEGIGGPLRENYAKLEAAASAVNAEKSRLAEALEAFKEREGSMVSGKG